MATVQARGIRSGVPSDRRPQPRTRDTVHGCARSQKPRRSGPRSHTEAWTPAVQEGTSYRDQMLHGGLDSGCSRSHVVQGPDHTPRLGPRLSKKARCIGTRCFTETWDSGCSRSRVVQGPGHTPRLGSRLSKKARPAGYGLRRSSSWFPE